MNPPKYSATDWQNFSLKKNVEKISKQLKNAETIGLTIAVDLSIAILTLILDNLIGFSTEKCRFIFFGIAAVIALIPLTILFVKWIYKFVSNKNVSVNSDTVREYIDTFDNEICYYVMIADSFLELLESTTTDNQKVFYFIETRFYINKSIDKLYGMIHKLDKIFDNDIDTVKNYKKVSTARLVNLLDLLFEIKQKASEQSIILEKKGVTTSKLSPDTIYDECFDQFIAKSNEAFSIDIQKYRIESPEQTRSRALQSQER